MEVERGWVSTVRVVLEGDTARKTRFLSPYSPRRGTVVGGGASSRAESITTLPWPCPYWFQLDLSY